MVKAFLLYVDGPLDLLIVAALLDEALELVCNDDLCLGLWQRELMLQLLKHLACVEGRVKTFEVRDKPAFDCFKQPLMQYRSDIVHSQCFIVVAEEMLPPAYSSAQDVNEPRTGRRHHRCLISQIDLPHRVPASLCHLLSRTSGQTWSASREAGRRLCISHSSPITEFRTLTMRGRRRILADVSARRYIG